MLRVQCADELLVADPLGRPGVSRCFLARHTLTTAPGRSWFTADIHGCTLTP
jgi:hypothetical protein